MMALITPGAVLQNRYRIVRLLAQGGFGTLYQAWDSSLGRPCALKENLDVSPDVQRQFMREAKILANLSHSNLPRVSDYFMISGQGQYLVMDFVDGKDLQEILEENGGPLPEATVLPWISQICDALSYLHSQSPPIIHRDIKPANIKITSQGQAVLIDFGIAKVYDPGLKTTVGAQAVTPGFSPHEQYGKGATDARTDIYALGATLYTLLTGQEPPESIQRVVRDPLVPARHLNPAVSMRTSGALARAMQMDATQRFQSAADFKFALISPPAIRLPVAQPPGYSSSPPLQGGPFVREVGGGATVSRSFPWGWLSLVGVLSIVILILLGVLTGANNVGRPVDTLPAGSRTSPADANLPVETTQLSPVESVEVAPTLPASMVSEVPAFTYTVQVGDTCSEIAQIYGVSIGAIVQLNDLSPDCGFLYAGQNLLIPGSFVGAASTSTVATSRAGSPAPFVSVTRIAPADGMSQVYIPAGEFKMGSSAEDQDARPDEKPQRTVYVGAFWMDQHEITNAMYAGCVRAGACRPPAMAGSRTRPVYFGEALYQDYPVIYVSWEDASVYCKWAGGRLPSEAEWEKAARGVDGRLFPWGDAAPSAILTNFNGQMSDTQPVGKFPAGASPYGILDMSGNVAEWVTDWYAERYYETGALRNPSGPASGEFRVLRGGSWFNQAQAIRAAFRLWNYPDVRSETIGFRCAR